MMAHIGMNFLKSAASLLSNRFIYPSSVTFIFKSLNSLTRRPVISLINKAEMKPILPALQMTVVRDFKVKGIVKRRCKDCYLVWRDERLYNICPTHPRHKQMLVQKRERDRWVLSLASQSKKRPWWSELSCL